VRGAAYDGLNDLRAHGSDPDGGESDPRAVRNDPDGLTIDHRALHNDPDGLTIDQRAVHNDPDGLRIDPRAVIDDQCAEVIDHLGEVPFSGRESPDSDAVAPFVDFVTVSVDGRSISGNPRPNRR